MPEEPVIDSWFACGYWKKMKEGLTPSEYEETVRRWNARRRSGRRVSLKEELDRLFPIDDSKSDSRSDES